MVDSFYEETDADDADEEVDPDPYFLEQRVREGAAAGPAASPNYSSVLDRTRRKKSSPQVHPPGEKLIRRAGERKSERTNSNKPKSVIASQLQRRKRKSAPLPVLEMTELDICNQSIGDGVYEVLNYNESLNTPLLLAELSVDGNLSYIPKIPACAGHNCDPAVDAQVCCQLMCRSAPDVCLRWDASMH